VANLDIAELVAAALPPPLPPHMQTIGREMPAASTITNHA